MSSNEELLASCNELARTFYAMQGYRVSDGFKFYESTHPHELGCWNMAVAAYDHIQCIEMDEVLLEVREG